MAYQLNVSDDERDTLKNGLTETINRIHNFFIVDHAQHRRYLYQNIYTVIISIKYDSKVNASVISIGCVSPKGAYEPRYVRCVEAFNYVLENLKDILEDLLIRYRNDNPKKGTLFFSFNAKNNVLKITNSGAMTICSRVFLSE